MAFPGFSAHAIRWLSELPANNNREWFQSNKGTYESELKAPMIALVHSINSHLAESLPEYYHDQPEKAIFRIYRDTRFSKDKTPYKTHVGASFTRRGIPDKAAGLYFQVGARGLGLAGGAYMPPNDSLLAIRGRIASEFDALSRLLAGNQLIKALGSLQGDALTRPPKGFPASHPAIELLKKKQFYFWAELPPEILTTPRLEKEILKHFILMHPVVLFLDDAVLAMRKKAARTEVFLR